MPASYYRMSSALALETARRRLIDEPHQSPTRVLGYLNRLILRVDYHPCHPPDRIIHEIDALARRLPIPPTEDKLALPSNDLPG